MGLLLLLLLLTELAPSAHSLVHHLVIHNDRRSIFKIESFGFSVGGTMSLDLQDFRVSAPSSSSAASLNRKSHKEREREKEKLVEQLDAEAEARALQSSGASSNSNKYIVGFLLRHATSESAAQHDLEKIMDRNECLFDQRRDNDIFIDLSDSSNWKKMSFVHVVDEQREVGFYSLIFAHCNSHNKDKEAIEAEGISKSKTKEVLTSHYPKSFKLDVVFQNPGPDFLSAGDAPLPMMYFGFFIVFSALMALWMFVLNSHLLKRGTSFATPAVHQIHYVMLMLITLKVLSLLFESIRYHYISLYGVSEGWSIVYYIFAGLKGIMLFTVILLIGSGYSLMKNYLSGNEKKVIYVVLILQVIDNIAMVILEETAPGSMFWLTWRDILHLVDVLCCLAILLPIVWSIRHLRQAAEVDGKAHNNLVKLQLFRQFYIVVVMYIYFTRIAVYLIESTMPFNLEWLGPFFNELATVAFYFHTGYQFRPASNNPYLPVSSEHLEGKEYGLDDDVFDASVEIELAGPSIQRKH